MPFPTYSSGTVSVEAAGTLVTGDGVYWSRAHARGGDLISIDGEPLVPIVAVAAITSPEDDQEITISEWQGGAKTDVPYVIYHTSIDRVLGRLAFEDIHKLIAAMNADGFFVFVHPDATEPDISDGDDGQYAMQPTSGKQWVKVDGEWQFLGIFAALSILGAWSAVVTYGTNNVVTRNGKAYYAKRSTLNDPPESSPDDWGVLVENGDRYDIAIFDTDRPASGEQIAKWVAPSSTIFRAGMTDSQAKADTASTGTAVFTFYKNGVQFATLTFTASATGVFACAVDTTFAIGDVLSVVSPNPRDATLGGVAIVAVAYRS